MGRGVKGKGREKGGRGGKREGPPCSQPPLLKNPGYGPGPCKVLTDIGLSEFWKSAFWLRSLV